jgi:ribosomal protein L16/L10AE
METWTRTPSNHGNVTFLLLNKHDKRLSPKRLEARRIAMVRTLRTYYPDAGTAVKVIRTTTPVVAKTRKALGARMGKGKGRIQEYVTPLYSNVPVIAFQLILPLTNSYATVLTRCRHQRMKKLGVVLVYKA